MTQEPPITDSANNLSSGQNLTKPNTEVSLYKFIYNEGLNTCLGTYMSK